jgi:hypothetical protein
MLKSGSDGPISEGVLGYSAENKACFTWRNPMGPSRLCAWTASWWITTHGEWREVDGLQGMKNPLTQECEACSPIHLPLDELHLRD